MATHVTTLTIDHTKVAGDLTDYVVAIVNDSDVGWDELYALATEGGGDIRIYKDDDTTELPREIVSFSVSSETGEIHVKYSGTLSSTVDTDIHIYADGTSSDYAVTATYGRNAVWSSSFRGVYHLNDLTTSTVLDSIATAGDGTKASANNPLEINGQIGKAQDYDKPDFIRVPNGSAFAFGTTLSFGCLLYFTETRYQISLKIGYATGSNNEIGMAMNADGNIFATAVVNSSQTTTTSPSAVSLNQWHKIKATYDGSNLRLYLNGSLVDTTANSGTLTHENVFPMLFGAFNTSNSGNGYDSINNDLSLNGNQDEVRFRAAVESDNWESTEYENWINRSTFYSVAAISSGYTQDLNETATAADSVQKDTTRNLSETGTLADSFSSQLVSLIELAETLTASDNLAARITGRVLSETISAADTVINTFSKVLAETASLAESLATQVYVSLELAEAVTLVENALYKLNGINALWRDIYEDTADEWSDIYNDL